MNLTKKYSGRSLNQNFFIAKVLVAFLFHLARGTENFEDRAEFKWQVQCVTIENRQSPFYVVNRVTLAWKKLY